MVLPVLHINGQLEVTTIRTHKPPKTSNMHCVRKQIRRPFYKKELSTTLTAGFETFFCLKSPGDMWIVQCSHKNFALSKVFTLKKSSPMFQIVAVQRRSRFPSHHFSASPPLPSVNSQDFGLIYLIKLISTSHAIGFENNLSELSTCYVFVSKFSPSLEKIKWWFLKKVLFTPWRLW